MIVGSLLLILVAVVLLVLGLTNGSSGLLIGSIAASLLAAVALVVGARQDTAARADEDDFLDDELDDRVRGGDEDDQTTGEYALAGARAGRPGQRAGSVRGGAGSPPEPPTVTLPVQPSGQSGYDAPPRDIPPYGSPRRPGWDEPDEPDEPMATPAAAPPTAAQPTPAQAAPARSGPEPPSTPGAPAGNTAPTGPATAGAPPVGTSARVEPDEDDYDDEDPPDEPAPQVVPAAVAARVAGVSTDVLVIDGRPRYHLPGCVHLLGRESEPLPASEAVDLGFTPCSLCEPATALATDPRRE